MAMDTLFIQLQSQYNYGKLRLILDIFAQRAKTKEGRLQVELAQYRYLLPRLIGMWSHLERQGGTSVRPDLCGQGYGQQMMKLAQTISQTLYPGKPLYLEVRSWNRRAIRCYEKAGFVAEGEPFIQRTPIGEGEFIRMVWRG